MALSGEGGGELLAGYPEYSADTLSTLLSALPQAITRALIRWLPNRHDALRSLGALSIRGAAGRSTTWFPSFSREERPKPFAPELLTEVDPSHPAQVFESYLEKRHQRTPLKRMLYADPKVWLPDNLLLRGDLMAMAASMEERVPFLDHKLMEFAGRVPTKLLTQAFRAKALLKRAFESFLSPRDPLPA